LFSVNGKTVSTEKNQKLICFLRDELRLISVKDGCSEGACGACTVLINGKATRACVFTTDKMEGKSIIADTGAYASLGGPVLERACTHASGPYHYENFQIDGYAYYTNNPPAGAFRGFGVTQTCFCIETMLNEMADIVGITPWEICCRNAIRPGEVLPNGQIVGPETGLVETLEAVKPYYDVAKYAGLACAMKNAGVGVGIPDTGRCRLEVEDGRIERMVAAHDVGRAVNPTSCEGQIEGGVVMGMGFTLTESYPVADCKPTAKFGTLGLFKANQIPEIKAIIVEKPGPDVACGAIGIGEITAIPTAPAIADAYYRYNGKRQYSLPLAGTPYSRKKQGKG